MKLLLMGVTFAVSSIPEGLPMVVTICLSVGCQDMVRRKAQVRKLPAVETLGSCNVICSDKTGTLTEGKMTLVKLCTFMRPFPGTQSRVTEPENSKMFAFWPTKGFNPNGGCFEATELTKTAQEDILKVFESGNVDEHDIDQSYDETLPDFGDPKGQNADSAQSILVRDTMLAAFLNSHETEYFYDPDKQLFQ